MAARRLHGLIYATIALCCMGIVICGVALGTDEWFSAHGTATSSELKFDVKYGLFKGKKTRTSPGSNWQLDLKLVCEGVKCMYSCGKNSAARKNDIQSIINNGVPIVCQAGVPGKSTNRQSDTRRDLVFLNFALLILTLLCLGLAIAFAALGGGLALYNTYRTPIQPVFSVFGLYIWNGISAACVFLGMVIWGVVFSTSLSKNAAISDTLVEGYSSDGNGSLGISYWILILAIVFPLINIGILRYRSWKIIQMEANHVKVTTEKLESGDILLF